MLSRLSEYRVQTVPKRKSRKKRVIKRFAIATAVRTINDKKEEQASSNAAAEATEQIQRRMHDAAYVGVELAAKPVRKAARSLYRSADSVVKDYRARKSVVRTAQRYRSADGQSAYTTYLQVHTRK